MIFKDDCEYKVVDCLSLDSCLARVFCDSKKEVESRNSVNFPLKWCDVVEVVLRLLNEYPSGITRAIISSALCLRLNKLLKGNDAKYSQLEERISNSSEQRRVQNEKPIECFITNVQTIHDKHGCYILFPIY